MIKAAPDSAGFLHVHLNRLVRRLMFLTGQEPAAIEEMVSRNLPPQSPGAPIVWTHYGDLLRKLAIKIGLERRALQLYDETEIRTLMAAVAGRVEDETRKNAVRARSCDWYPVGWQGSLTAARSDSDHGESAA